MSKTQDYKDTLFFLLKLLAIWLSWKGIIYLLGEESLPLKERMFPAISAPWEFMNQTIREMVINGAELLLNLFGYETENTGYILRIKGNGGVSVGNYCLGIHLMYYFIMLLLISKISWMKKLIGSVTGILITNVLNVFRIAIFNVVKVSAPYFLPVMHDYIFNAIVLGALFVFYLFLLREPDSEPGILNKRKS